MHTVHDYGALVPSRSEPGDFDARRPSWLGVQVTWGEPRASPRCGILIIIENKILRPRPESARVEPDQLLRKFLTYTTPHTSCSAGFSGPRGTGAAGTHMLRLRSGRHEHDDGQMITQFCGSPRLSVPHLIGWHWLPSRGRVKPQVPVVVVPTIRNNRLVRQHLGPLATRKGTGCQRA